MGIGSPILDEGGASREKPCQDHMSHINRFNAAGYPDPTAYEALTRVETELHLSAFRPIVYICSPFSGDTETKGNYATCLMREFLKTDVRNY